jgi:putative aminopeptidase FrvX
MKRKVRCRCSLLGMFIVLLAGADANRPAFGQARDATEKLLAELTNANGAPGFEGPVRDILRREWQGLLADLHTDGMGNLLGTLGGATDAPRVLLMAHMDEVGFLVRHIDDRGFIYFNRVGGYFAQSVLTQRMIIMTPSGPVTGYTGFKSGHILSADERSHLVPLQDMFIDIGAQSREEAMEKFGIRPGLPVTYGSEFEVLNGTNRYLARAIDDRALLAIATEASRQLKDLPHPNSVVVAATVQEEVGMRGASVVYASAKPDIVINLEIGVAGDFPLMTSPKLSQEALGKGPSIFVFDGSMIPNNKFVDWTLKVAREGGIPVQFESITGFGEDGAQLQKSGQGTPSINLGLPTRYAHSQLGVMDRSDYDQLLELVVLMIQKLSAAEVRSIGAF